VQNPIKTGNQFQKMLLSIASMEIHPAWDEPDRRPIPAAASMEFRNGKIKIYKNLNQAGNTYRNHQNRNHN